MQLFIGEVPIWDRVLLITGLDYWTGPLDSHIFGFTLSEVIFVMSLKTKGLQGAFYPL